MTKVTNFDEWSQVFATVERRFERHQRSKGRPAGVGLHQFRLVGRLAGSWRSSEARSLRVVGYPSRRAHPQRCGLGAPLLYGTRAKGKSMEGSRIFPDSQRFDFEDKATDALLTVTGSIAQQFSGIGIRATISLAAANGAEDGDTGEEASFSDR
jgi:hypothetical protein